MLFRSSQAVDSVHDSHTVLSNVKLPTNPQETGRLASELHVKKGARVMLVNNVNVTDGLVNGAMGTVTHILMKKVGQQEQIDVILVHFDNARAGAMAVQKSVYKDIDANSVPITRVQITFPVRGKKSYQASRSQFPLCLAWAITIHKCQGLTLSEIVIDMTPI